MIPVWLCGFVALAQRDRFSGCAGGADDAPEAGQAGLLEKNALRSVFSTFFAQLSVAQAAGIAGLADDEIGECQIGGDALQVFKLFGLVLQKATAAAFDDSPVGIDCAALSADAENAFAGQGGSFSICGRLHCLARLARELSLGAQIAPLPVLGR